MTKICISNMYAVNKYLSNNQSDSTMSKKRTNQEY